MGEAEAGPALLVGGPAQEVEAPLPPGVARPQAEAEAPGELRLVDEPGAAGGGVLQGHRPGAQVVGRPEGPLDFPTLLVGQVAPGAEGPLA